MLRLEFEVDVFFFLFYCFASITSCVILFEIGKVQKRGSVGENHRCHSLQRV